MQTVSFDDVAVAATNVQTSGQSITIDAIREMLGGGTVSEIAKHLQAWRNSQPKQIEPIRAELPESLMSELSRWAQQHAEQAGLATRDALAQSESDMDALLKAGEELEAEKNELQSKVATSKVECEERDEQIERLTAEVRDARRVAADALVGKAKDQLAIDGKDAQIVDLRNQLERYVSNAATDSDAKLAAQMELIGATTARDNLASELQQLRTQLDGIRAERTALRAEVEMLRSR
jgi:peptidoglycan hydrolase CwlO-like protein